jgi:hypothetical protein
MEPASNLQNSAAVPFCSHSRIINASLANYDTSGFKLGQLLETGTVEAVANDQTWYHFFRIGQAGQAHFSPGSLGRSAHKTLRGECVTQTQ